MELLAEGVEEALRSEKGWSVKDRCSKARSETASETSTSPSVSSPVLQSDVSRSLGAPPNHLLGHPDDTREVLREGVLEKKGDWRGTFRARYLKVHRNGVITHYLSREASAPRGRMTVIGATSEVLSPTADGKWPFVVRATGYSPLTLRAESEADRLRWLEALTLASAKRPASEQVEASI